jgi:hypothetical protein
MAFEDGFDELDSMLLAKSTDYEKMRAFVQRMRQADELVQMLGPAEDRLYASIAHGTARRLLILRPAISKQRSVKWLAQHHGLSGALGIPILSRLRKHQRCSMSCRQFASLQSVAVF